MIKLEGTIKQVFETKTYGSGFEKRIFWLDDNHPKFRNIFALELWKKDCEMIDSYKVGDQVTAYIDIKGIYWQEDGKGEMVKNTLKCWNLEKDGKTFKPL